MRARSCLTRFDSLIEEIEKTLNFQEVTVRLKDFARMLISIVHDRSRVSGNSDLNIALGGLEVGACLDRSSLFAGDEASSRIEPVYMHHSFVALVGGSLVLGGD